VDFGIDDGKRFSSREWAAQIAIASLANIAEPVLAVGVGATADQHSTQSQILITVR
jgi:hypothetical protein